MLHPDNQETTTRREMLSKEERESYNLPKPGNFNQKFFKVSSVDDKISKMLDEGSDRVRATIQKIRKNRYKSYNIDSNSNEKY